MKAEDLGELTKRAERREQLQACVHELKGQIDAVETAVEDLKKNVAKTKEVQATQVAVVPHPPKHIGSHFWQLRKLF